MNNPAHNGATQAVRDALAASTEPLSSLRLSMLTGYKVDKVRAALDMLANVRGGIVATRGRQGTVYALYRAKEPAKSQGQRAGRIVIGRGAVWGAGLV